MGFKRHKIIEKRLPYKHLSSKGGTYSEKTIGGKVFMHSSTARTKHEASEIAKINRFQGMPSRVVKEGKEYSVYIEKHTPIEHMMKSPAIRLGYERGRSRRF